MSKKKLLVTGSSGLIGSEVVTRECRLYEESKDWQFVNSLDVELGEGP